MKIKRGCNGDKKKNNKTLRKQIENRGYKPYIFSNYIEHKLIEHSNQKAKTGGRRQDGGGVGRRKHFLPHKFIKRTFKRRVNSTKQLLNAGRGHQAPRKATQLLERR